MRIKLPMIFALIAALAPAALGQVTLRDRNFAYVIDPANSGMVDLLYRGDLDSLDQHWWWIRGIQGAETALPAPNSISQPDDTHATLAWANLLDGALDATLSLELVVTGGGQGHTAKVVHALELVNVSSNDVDVSVFQYVDTLPFSFGDEFAWGGLSGIDIDTGIIGAPPAEFRAVNAEAFQVAAAPTILELLEDANADNLDNSGLPFGPGDFSGAFQWSRTIPPGGSALLVGSYQWTIPSPAGTSLLALGIWRLFGTRRRGVPARY